MIDVRRWRSVLLGVILVCAIAPLVACDGEDRPGSVSVSGTAAESGTGSGSGTGIGSGSGTGVGTEPGVVQPRPSGATQVDVVLKEWSVNPAQTSVAAGDIYFHVDNQGPEDPHELVVVKTDLPLDQLPVKDGKVDEEQVEVIGEVEAFAPNSQASGTFTLEPGSYVLLCNIAEQEAGELESHYLNGMRTAFTVN